MSIGVSILHEENYVLVTQTKGIYICHEVSICVVAPPYIRKLEQDEMGRVSKGEGGRGGLNESAARKALGTRPPGAAALRAHGIETKS